MNIKNTDEKHIHDLGYKQFFYNKEALLDLIVNQLHTPWADKLRLEDLKLISSEGVDDDFKKKSGDIVYEASIDGQDIIFIIMLEFQSSVDYSMPVRLLQYMLIQLNRYMADHYKQPNVKDLKIPIIFPIVLYNGKDKWNAALELKELYENAELFGGGILNFKYDILDVNNNYSKQELIDNPNLTSVLFLFDQKVDAYEIQHRALELLPKYHEFSTQQREIVETWIENTLEHQLAKFLIKLLKLTPEEGAQMIANNSRAFSELEEMAEKRGMERGLEKGMQQGIDQGIQQGIVEEQERQFKEKLVSLKKMMDKSISLEDACDILGLRIDEIKDYL